MGTSLSQTLPLVVVVAVSSGLSLLYGAAYVQFGQDVFAFVNQIGPSLLFLTCGWARWP